MPIFNEIFNVNPLRIVSAFMPEQETFIVNVLNDSHRYRELTIEPLALEGQVS